jgi:hypothetical protein
MFKRINDKFNMGNNTPDIDQVSTGSNFDRVINKIESGDVISD